jgi:hypothetical protein
MNKSAALLVYGLGLNKKAGLAEDIEYAKAKLTKDLSDAGDGASNWISDKWNEVKGRTSSALEDAKAYVKDRAGAAIRGGGDYLEDSLIAGRRKLRDLKGNKYVDDIEDWIRAKRRAMRDKLYSNSDVADEVIDDAGSVYSRLLNKLR